MSREEPADTKVKAYPIRPLDQPVTLLAWPIELPLEGAMQQFQQVDQENLGPNQNELEGEVALMLWLLVMGVNSQRWNEQASRASEPDQSVLERAAV